ncbi:MAG TPA: ABC transporter substrate-binding protein [Thermoanaerobaculia bacterium]
MVRRLAVLSLLVCLAAPLADAKLHVVRPFRRDVRIGALFSLTGDGASLGTASAAALDVAARDINAELAALSSPYRVTVDVEDTQLTPSVALAKLQALDARGVHLVIGPQSSAEAREILPYANEHRIVLVSQASTASSLAIENDYLFRFAPNDKLEGAAQAALLRADGIDTIVELWRDDAGNGGLAQSTRRSFEALGGHIAFGVAYPPTTTDFAAQVTALGNTVRAARTGQPAAHIAVYLASFEEAADIFRLARLDADLAAVRWYGADGVTQSRALVDDATVASFAAATHFTAPNVGLDESARDFWQPVSDEIRTRIGFTPDAYALSVYDAAWVAVLAMIEVDDDDKLLRESFTRNVQRHWGLTGPTALDPAGDRKIANFDFWTVVNGEWVRTAQYASGHISR